MSVFLAPSKELLEVAAKSPAPVVEAVIAAHLQLEVCHEDTVLVFSDFSTVCNVPWEACSTWGAPGHSLQKSFHGRYHLNTNLADFESLLPVGSTSKKKLFIRTYVVQTKFTHALYFLRIKDRK